MDNKKQEVYEFWNQASCGESLYLSESDKNGYIAQSNSRYSLEGELIFSIAHFDQVKGLKVLEVGVGLGADHQKFAESGAELFGIDLTERAVDYTKKRLEIFDLKSNLSVGDAENLKFENESFDQVYSWGVLHHSPDTPKAISEVWRVLKSGGLASIMVYHKWSVIGLILWLRYALFRLKPWLTLSQVYDRYLESPGTKAYSIAEAQKLFSTFSEVKIKTKLTHGDLLESNVGQRHQGLALSFAKKLWPRTLLRLLLPNSGLFMLIEARR
ncbi:MAG: hypothetical protein COA79_11430 [Planctomycetota bacterium]|nr:MAG: hypothetical protein COA79_11430 [Planctomycetota bacterium]